MVSAMLVSRAGARLVVPEPHSKAGLMGRIGTGSSAGWGVPRATDNPVVPKKNTHKNRVNRRVIVRSWLARKQA